MSFAFKAGEEEQEEAKEKGGLRGRLEGGAPCSMSCQCGVHLKAKEIKAL